MVAFGVTVSGVVMTTTDGVAVTTDGVVVATDGVPGYVVTLLIGVTVMLQLVCMVVTMSLHCYHYYYY